MKYSATGYSPSINSNSSLVARNLAGSCGADGSTQAGQQLEFDDMHYVEISMQQRCMQPNLEIQLTQTNMCQVNRAQVEDNEVLKQVRKCR